MIPELNNRSPSVLLDCKSFYLNTLRCMRILLVEDEKKIATFAQQGLKEQGFQVEWVDNGDEAYAVARTEPFDVIILDIMVPGRDGLSILRNLREQKINTPVILLTARSSLNERLEGLNLGADDYLTKPFYVEELVARIRAVSRRSDGHGVSLLRIEDLILNQVSREVHRKDRKIELSPREFALLEYLMRSPGRVYTRTQIFEHVWNYDFDPSTNLVEVNIQRLRKKISDEGESNLIETIRGVGYRMGQSEE